MPSAHRMMNLITSFGFVYKTFQNMFAMHDRASEKLQTPDGLFHHELQLGACHCCTWTSTPLFHLQKQSTLTCHTRDLMNIFSQILPC